MKVLMIFINLAYLQIPIMEFFKIIFNLKFSIINLFINQIYLHHKNQQQKLFHEHFILNNFLDFLLEIIKYPMLKKIYFYIYIIRLNCNFKK